MIPAKISKVSTSVATISAETLSRMTVFITLLSLSADSLSGTSFDFLRAVTTPL